MISPDYVDREGRAWWKENSIPNSSDKIMQFTGLKDKNGKEIFEGDLIKYDYNSTPITRKRGVVEYRESECCYYFADLLLEPTPRKTIEVIGNVWENPDLLTPKAE